MSSRDRWKFSPLLQTPLTVPVHSPNDRNAVRAMQGYCEKVWSWRLSRGLLPSPPWLQGIHPVVRWGCADVMFSSQLRYSHRICTQQSKIAKTPESLSIRYRSYAKVWDQWLIDVVWMVLVIWGAMLCIFYGCDVNPKPNPNSCGLLWCM